MAVKEMPTTETDVQLAEFISQFRYDAYGFVMAAFPWGEEGTSLVNRTGPEKWQKQLLDDMSKTRSENRDLTEIGLDITPFRAAVVSGHGVGKSALVAWVCLWLMATSPNMRGVVTANTGEQLETRTWPELAKWHNMSIVKHWFQWNATNYCFALCPEENRKNYMLTAQTVSKEKTEAFAGLHNDGGTILAIFDEASGIESNIWEVVEGAMTDGECFFLVFGNPTRPDGEFRECFRKNKDFYFNYHVDSREVSHTNKVALQQIIDKYGADSDAAKIRVYGQFPDRSYDGFISEAVFRACVERDPHLNPNEPLILGVDVAGMGDDSTVLYPRKGNDARTLPRIKIHKADGETIARRIAEWYRQYKPDAIIMENIGPGQAVMSILKLWGIPFISAPVGAPSANKAFANVRMEIWDKMLTWMTGDGVLPDDPELFTQATTIRYTLQGDAQKQQMERKKDMKARGLKSPDDMDALALTFYAPVAKRGNRPQAPGTKNGYETDYDMMGF